MRVCFWLNCKIIFGVKLYLSYFFKKNGQTTASFCLFSFFSPDKYSKNTINDKNVDGVLGTRTQGGRMVDADESTELWQHPFNAIFRIVLVTLNCKLSKRPERYHYDERYSEALQ